STGSWITADAIVPRSARGGARPRAATMPSLNLRQNVEWIERETIRRALETSAVKRQAAQAMGITPRPPAYYLNNNPRPDPAARFGGPHASEPAFQLRNAPPETTSSGRTEFAHASDRSPLE